MTSSIEDFKKQNEPKEFEIHGGQVVKLQPPSLLKLATSGNIPNIYMGTLLKLLKLKKEDKELNDLQTLKERLNTAKIFCMASMVEPKFEEVEEYLSDEQIFDIYYIATGFGKDLEKFHTKQEYSGDVEHSENVSEEA